MSYTKENDLMDEDITDKEFEEKYIPFYNNFNDYMKTFVIPDAVAFYLASGYDRSCLDDCPLKNHLNSAVDIFNIICDVDELIPTIEMILKIKYNLKITQTNPLKIEKSY